MNLLQCLQIFEVHGGVEKTYERVDKLKYHQLDGYVRIMLFLRSKLGNWYKAMSKINRKQF